MTRCRVASFNISKSDNISHIFVLCFFMAIRTEEDSARAGADRAQAKQADLESQIAAIKVQKQDFAEKGVQFIELSQGIAKAWIMKDKIGRRKMLDSILLNCVWNGKTMKPEYRKPFDVLAVAKNFRGKKKRLIPKNQPFC